MSHDILIVDDEVDIRTLIAGILDDEGYKSREAGNSDEVVAALKTRRPSLIILDIWLRGSRLDGLQILDEIKRDHPYVPVIVISGHGTIETAVAAIKKGAFDFIEKPFKADRLLLMIERAIETARLRRENEELTLKTGGPLELIGTSMALQQVRQTIARVGPTGSRVLITGPAGVGKEMVARLIHAQSPREEGPFVVLNCSAFAQENLEAQLFGADPKQGAVGRVIGLLEQAHGGTLLLNEVADMPLETQGKILRALQDQAFQRVNSTDKIQVDVRVLASTVRNLKVEMEAGRFRQDLYSRLNIVSLYIPGLAERREDIPLLARHFITMAARIAGLPERTFGEDAMAALQSYDWPGNVRQLRTVIDWLLARGNREDQQVIRADMLPPEITSGAPAVLQWDKGGTMMGLPLREAREVFEKEYLVTQLVRFGGNISRTATFVGMERSALHRKLKSLGLQNGEPEESVET